MDDPTAGYLDRDNAFAAAHEPVPAVFGWELTNIDGQDGGDGFSLVRE